MTIKQTSSNYKTGGYWANDLYADMTAARYASTYIVEEASGLRKIHAIGGYSGGYVSTNYRFDPSTNTWTTLTALGGAARSQLASSYRAWTGTQYRLFCYGGYTGSYQNLVYRYDYVNDGSNTWTALTNMTATRAYWSAASLGQYAWLFGGYNGTVQSTVWRYDMDADTWVTAGYTAMPAARCLYGLAKSGTDVYIIAGSSSGLTTASNTLYKFDTTNPTAGGAWTTLTAMPISVAACSAVCVGDFIYVAANDTDTLTPLQTMLRYSIRKDKWEWMPDQPLARSLLGGKLPVTAEGAIHVIGGYTGAGSSSNHQVFFP